MRPFAKAALLAIFVLASGCAGSRPASWDHGAAPPPAAFVQEGWASYYGTAHHGHRTASGVRFDEHQLTAAHRSLPFGTQVRVTNLENGRTVMVTINDRGPFTKKRVIDVSSRAARELGFLRAGMARVRLEVGPG
jgi:rare lipoprotein A